MLKNPKILVSADMPRKVSDRHRAHRIEEEEHVARRNKQEKQDKKHQKHDRHVKHERRDRHPQGKPGQVIETRIPKVTEKLSTPPSVPMISEHKHQPHQQSAPIQIPKFSYGNAVFDKGATMPIFTTKPETISIVRAYIPPENKLEQDVRHVNLVSGVISWEALPSADGESYTELCIEVSAMLSEPGKAPPPGMIGEKEQIIYRTNDSALDSVCPSRTTSFQYAHELAVGSARPLPIWYKIQVFVGKETTSARLKDQTPVCVVVTLHETRT